jgi:hypothetical protein
VNAKPCDGVIHNYPVGQKQRFQQKVGREECRFPLELLKMRACGFKPMKACAHQSFFCADFAAECRATTHHGSAPDDGRVVKKLLVLPDRGFARFQPKLPQRI